MIREYTKTDYEEVARLWKKCFSGTLRPIDSKEVMNRLVQHSPGFFLVAEETGKVIGSVFAGYDGRQATVHRLSVLPEHQRRGIGTTLMQELMDRLEKVKPLEVLTHADPDPHVLKIYESRGFSYSDSRYMKKKIY